MPGQKINYEIFDDIHTFEVIRTQMEDRYSNAENSYFCNSINYDRKYGEELINICKMLVYLYNISLQQYENKDKIISSMYPEFMNYLINFKLEAAGCDESEKNKFYNQVTSKYDVFDAKDVLETKMYVIDYKYISNMHILYKLYNNYDKLKEDRNPNYINFLNEMKSQYNYGLEKCFYDGDIKFCKALEKFRDYYVNNETSAKNYCHGKQCQTLPKLILPEPLSNKDQLKIAKIGNSLIRNTYTTSLERHPDVYKEKYFNLKYLIFLQYNLHMEEDNDKNDYAMIKILYEFIQYCNENKDNLKLASFMKEFIKEYYNKKNTLYDTIFNECKNSVNTKEYCTLYKKCENSFKTDLEIIKTDASYYIKKQENYINSFSPLGRFILEAKDMFQDFEKMSKYSPTIMSTMVAIVVCLFFLYKLTPLNSIFCKGKKKRKKIPLFFPERREYLQDDNTGHKKVKPQRGKIRFSYQPT
ncbi:PIR protein [Plasmodium vivax]|uniref:VIR protein n=1 Tax=Plasmodium vivax TaxID=5855 RepID=A0A565A712_PLAVI|nr:PIR protein [Plasmodium vivax]